MKLKGIVALALVAVSFQAQAKKVEQTIHCFRNDNPPVENRVGLDWPYEEFEVSTPQMLDNGEWNVKVGSGYFSLTDLGKVSATKFDVMVYPNNSAYDVSPDLDDPFGALKGVQDSQGNWKITFKAREWKKAEAYQCKIWNGSGHFKTAEDSW